VVLVVLGWMKVKLEETSGKKGTLKNGSISLQVRLMVVKLASTIAVADTGAPACIAGPLQIRTTRKIKIF